MKKISYLFNYQVYLGIIGVLLFLVLMGSFGYKAPTSISKDIDKTAKAKIQEAYGKLPLYFIQNNGQVDEKVKYYEKGSGHATFFTKEGVYLALDGRPDAGGKRQAAEGAGHKAQDKRQAKKSASRNPKSEIIKLSPVGANKNPEIVAKGRQEGKVNYFTGNNPEKWRTNIPTYRAVVYKEIYPGIDMKFYGSNSQLEYDIIVSPGADPSTVRLSYEGIESMKVTDEGDLEIGIKTCPEQGQGSCNIVQKRPYIYQVIDGKRVEVDGKFKIQDANPKSQIPNSHTVFSSPPMTKTILSS